MLGRDLLLDDLQKDVVLEHGDLPENGAAERRAWRYNSRSRRKEQPSAQGAVMAWIVGIDEAGYGPNLGPFVMTVGGLPGPDDALADACLWQALRPAVRRAADADDGRLAVDDSKARLHHRTAAWPAWNTASSPPCGAMPIRPFE